VPTPIGIAGILTVRLYLKRNNNSIASTYGILPQVMTSFTSLYHRKALLPAVLKWQLV
jgi:hypothetical protein